MVGSLSDAIMSLPCVSSCLGGGAWSPVIGKKKPAPSRHFLTGPQHLVQFAFFSTKTLPEPRSVSYAFTAVAFDFSCTVDEAGDHFPCWTEGSHGLPQVTQLAKLGPQRKSGSWPSSRLKNPVSFWPRENQSRPDFPQHGQLFAF